MADVNPESQALTGVFHDARVTEIQRVAAARPVVIIAIFSQPIIAAVINPPQREGLTMQIQLGAVIQHHIEDHLDTGLMQRFYRIAKLVQRVLRCAGVTRRQGKHRQRVVAPVVAQPHPQ